MISLNELHLGKNWSEFYVNELSDIPHIIILSCVCYIDLYLKLKFRLSETHMKHESMHFIPHYKCITWP